LLNIIDRKTFLTILQNQTYRYKEKNL
jgi:hypothetical protein